MSSRTCCGLSLLLVRIAPRLAESSFLSGSLARKRVGVLGKVRLHMHATTRHDHVVVDTWADIARMVRLHARTHFVRPSVVGGCRVSKLVVPLSVGIHLSIQGRLRLLLLPNGGTALQGQTLPSRSVQYRWVVKLWRGHDLDVVPVPTYCGCSPIFY
ncbi:hypothetical protein P171DRAFT_40885 [Karstenula rhodostoma CBS 690.94]|uniref:Secreted protein n=1 Tax=Karstenula rhodostoma CBS 690.94 TaxID=1392251 RepID=A0A9P4UBY5_9PLEO|nr:hypothetical protein P171DRAFT_40885 [Karstenula rhodostoma CBS 690.94]